MGIYVNPGNVNFTNALRSKIFVDKSLLIDEISKLVNTEDKYVCVSRARRFGKSMAANMLAAYFSKGCDSRRLFEGLNISNVPGYDEYLNKFNVIKFDVNGFLADAKSGDNVVEAITRKIRKELIGAFPDADIEKDSTLADCLLSVYAVTGEQFVIIIDEYDVLIREQVPKRDFDAYLKFLNALFKNADLSPAIALAYLTGILPIVRDKVQSKLNLFTEYSMLDSHQLVEFTGFTTAEVQALCKEYNMDFDECRRWYDGYKINGREVYSPRSVVSAMDTHEYGGYWVKTGSFESLNDYIKMNLEGTREDVKAMLGGGAMSAGISIP